MVGAGRILGIHRLGEALGLPIHYNEGIDRMRPTAPDEQDLPRVLQPVIIGADFCGYAYIRCFWEAYGVESIVLASADIKTHSRSRFADYRVIDGLDDEVVLLRELERLGDELIAAGNVPFLVGCGDHYARLISQNKPLLEERYYVPYIDFDLLDEITQKENFYRICEEIGIPYPKTVYLDCADPDAEFDDGGMAYPLIAKPSNSAAYHYADIPNKKKVFLVQDREELEAIFGDLKRSCYDRSLIVQEFIPGDDTQIRILSAYTDSDANPVFMCGGRVVLEDHSPTAIGNPAVIIPERNQRVLEDAARFMKHVGYHGMANFDVKFDERDGSYRFFEINTRPGRSSFFAWQAGVNFAKVQVDDVLMGAQLGEIAADRPFVYTTVPPYVVRRSVADPEIRARVLGAFKDGTAQFPLFWERESLPQKFWAAVNYYHQISKFQKYVWGRGAADLA